MFCPSCGSEERQASQYCRACGTDLRGVRIGLERPDSITQSAISAREEVGRAVADKIREMEDVRYLHQFARKVLPQVEKFLESPEEKRLRRLRSGTVMSLIGFMTGFASFFVLVNSRKDEIEFIFGCLLALSLLILGAGLASLINGLLFSRPRKGVKDNADEARLQSLLSARLGPPPVPTNVAGPFNPQTTSNLGQPRGSVTEHTTVHLKSER